MWKVVMWSRNRILRETENVFRSLFHNGHQSRGHRVHNFVPAGWMRQTNLVRIRDTYCAKNGKPFIFNFLRALKMLAKLSSTQPPPPPPPRGKNTININW